ncbi:MAG: hypothetical protein WD178_11195, partial [Actinomycetota bacterium]
EAAKPSKPAKVAAPVEAPAAAPAAAPATEEAPAEDAEPEADPFQRLLDDTPLPGEDIEEELKAKYKDEDEVKHR